VYFDGESKEHMVKRFIPEMSDRKVLFISEAEGSALLVASTDTFPRIQVEFPKMGKVDRSAQEIDLESFIGVKGLKAKGKKLANHPPKKILVLESLPEPEIEVKDIENSQESGGVEGVPNIVANLEDDDPQMRLFDSTDE
jgi:topoisomerase-4 subunit A